MAEHDQDDPPRLSSDASTPAGLGALFERAQQDAPPLGELDRAWTGIAKQTGTGGAPPPAETLAWKLGTVVAVITAGAALIWAVRDSKAPEQTLRAPAAMRAPERVRVVQVPTLSPSGETLGAPPTPAPAPEQRPARVRPAIRAAAPSSTPAPEPAQDELAEGALLLRARRALASDPALSLSLTQEHLRLAPSGRLAPEREVIAIEALGALGRANEARARAERFVARWPDSAHRPRVERWLAHN